MLLKLCVLVGWAWAQEVPTPTQAEPLVEVPAPPPLTQEEIWAAMAPEDVLAEVVARRRIGDYSGAIERLDHLSVRGALKPQVDYHRGIIAEVQENYEVAVDWYQEVMEVYPDTPYAADAAFRRAYCLEDLGEHRESLRAIRQLQRSGKWSESDAYAMGLQRGIVELRSGKTRRGIRRILRNLKRTELNDDQKWIQSKARLALVRAQLKAAAELELTGNKRGAKRLKIRSRLMASAEEQAIAAFRLGEPEFALEGLLLLGDGYMQLYRDMLASPPPRSLPPEDHEIYRAAVKKKSAILVVKAHARYAEGVRVAARTQWQGTLTDQLKARRDATAP